MIEQHGLKEGLAKWGLRSASAAAATSAAKSTDQAKVPAATKKQQRIDSMKKLVVKMKQEPTTIVIDESGAGDGEKSKPATKSPPPGIVKKARIGGGGGGGGAADLVGDGVTPKKQVENKDPASAEKAGPVSGGSAASLSDDEDDDDDAKAGQRAVEVALRMSQTSVLGLAASADLAAAFLGVNVELSKATKVGQPRGAELKQPAVQQKLRQMAGPAGLIEAGFIVVVRARWNTWGDKLQGVAVNGAPLSVDLKGHLRRIGACAEELDNFGTIL